MSRDYTKIFIAAVLGIFLLLILVQIVKFSGRMRGARMEYDAAKAEYDRTAAEGVRLQSEYEYFSNPENLNKELRSRFNYTLPGEKLLILVPKASSTSD